MKKTKRLFSVLLALILVCSMVPLGGLRAAAASSIPCDASKKNYDTTNIESIREAGDVVGGHANVDPGSVSAGGTVTITLSPQNGYVASNVISLVKRQEGALTSDEGLGTLTPIENSNKWTYKVTDEENALSEITGFLFVPVFERVYYTVDFNDSTCPPTSQLKVIVNGTVKDTSNLTVSPGDKLEITYLSGQSIPGAGLYTSNSTSVDMNSIGGTYASGTTFYFRTNQTAKTLSFEQESFFSDYTLEVNGQSFTSAEDFSSNNRIFGNASIKVTPKRDYAVSSLTLTSGGQEVATAASGSLQVPSDISSYTTNFTLAVSVNVAHDVTVEGDHPGGTVNAPAKAAENSTVYVTVTPDTGYEVGSFVVKDTSTGAAYKADFVTKTDTGYSFTMPKEAVTISVTFKQKDYTVTAGAASNGTVEVSPTTAHYEETITVTATPNEGYKLSGKPTVTGVNPDNVEDKGNNQFTFTMPAANVTVSAEFVAKAKGPTIKFEYTATGTSDQLDGTYATSEYDDETNTVYLNITPPKGLMVSPKSDNSELPKIEFSETSDMNPTLTRTYGSADFNHWKFNPTETEKNGSYKVTITFDSFKDNDGDYPGLTVKWDNTTIAGVDYTSSNGGAKDDSSHTITGADSGEKIALTARQETDTEIFVDWKFTVFTTKDSTTTSTLLPTSAIDFQVETQYQSPNQATATIEVPALNLENYTTDYLLISADFAPAWKVTFKANNGTGNETTTKVKQGGTLTLPNLSKCGFTEPENKKFVGWAKTQDATGTAILPEGSTFTPDSNTTLYAIWESTGHEHVWDGGTVTKEATCTEKGVKTYTCTVNGCTETKTEEILAGHSYQLVARATATETAPGHLAYYECIRCKHLFSEESGDKEIQLLNITTYHIKAEVTAGGSLVIKVGETVLSGEGLQGDTITVEAKPNAGYQLKEGSLKYNSTVLTPTDNSASFTMPGAAVVIAAAFEAIKPSITTTSLSEGKVGVEYSQTIAVTNDSGQTLTYSATGLPDGLEINSSTGAISGTPTKAVTNKSVTVTVSTGITGGETSVTLTLTIAKGAAPVAPAVTAEAPTTANGNGKITGTTTAMEYKLSTAADSAYATCSATSTEVEPGTYLVRLKTTDDYEAGQTKEVVIPAVYSITVNSGSATPSLAQAGTSVTVTAAAPETGKQFKEWTGANDLTFSNGSATTATATFTMPANAVTLTATYEDIPITTYTVTVNNATNGTVTADKTTAAQNETVTLTVSPNSGYQLDTLTVTGNSTVTTQGSDTTYTFKMPGEAVTVTATFKQITYSITVNSATNGTVSADKTSAAQNDNVTLTVTPAIGYELDTLTVSGSSAIETTKVNDTTYTFTMPGAAVTVSATFKQITYTVTVNSSTNGTVTCTVTEAPEGQEIIVSTTADDGYRLTSLTYTPDSGSAVPIDLTTKKFTMPASNVTITATFEAIPTYKINITTPTNGTITSSPTENAVKGTTVTLDVVPVDGYRLKKLTYTPQGGTEEDITTSQSFMMPDKDVKVSAEFEAIPTHTLTLNAQENGSMTASPSGDVREGTKVILTLSPNPGYRVLAVTAHDASNNPVTVSSSGGNYTFTMPDKDVTVTATFSPVPVTPVTPVTPTPAEPDPEDPGEDPQEDPEADAPDVEVPSIVNRDTVQYDDGNTQETTVWSNGRTVVVDTTPEGDKTVQVQDEDGQVVAEIDLPVEPAGAPREFVDVAEDAWYKGPVDEMVSRGIFAGTSESTFSPSSQMTRGMVVTVLYNLSGRTEYGTDTHAFEDVPDTSYYAKPSDWGAAAQIVYGTDLGFSGEDVVTREQLIRILYRYASLTGISLGGGVSLSGFTDSGRVSGYARTAMEWAVGNGLMSGRGNGILDPRGPATRAEVATILAHFLNLMM